MLLRKSKNSEILDDFTITDERIDEVLYELKKINRFLGGKKVSNAGVKQLLRNCNVPQVKVLDVGSGGSDIFENLNGHCEYLEIFSMDLNIRACFYSKQKTMIQHPICSDARFFPFKSKSFDIIHLSLFLHHFSEYEIINLLNIFYKEAKIGIIINDLRRNILAYLGIKLVSLVFIKSRIVKNDGPLSVKRGFTRKEIKEFLERSAIQYYQIKRKWAFRWLIIIRKPDNDTRS